MALTWPELEYSETCTIPPESWMAFLESHRWTDPDRAERIFSLATDIVMTAKRASRQRVEFSGRDFRAPLTMQRRPISEARTSRRRDGELKKNRQ
jgi:hypothetical protein